MRSLLSAFSLTLLLAGSALGGVAAPAALERYTFAPGQDADNTSSSLRDRNFGNGTARSRVAFFDTRDRLNSEDTTTKLTLEVTRTVRRGEVVFALLCFGVEVRGFDSEGTPIYSQDLAGFTFGDSKGGTYRKSLTSIPVRVARLEVTFLGNYE